MQTPESILPADLDYGRSVYNDNKYGVVVLRSDEKMNGCGLSASILEHRAMARQYQFNLCGTEPVPRRLPAGSYTLFVTGLGYNPLRKDFVLKPDRILDLTAKLEKRSPEESNFRTILGRYRIPFEKATTGKLSVKDGATFVLDSKARGPAKSRHVLEITSVDRAKEIVGNADIHWASKTPRYGRLCPPEPNGEVKGELTPLGLAALREYVYGNSKSVSAWKGPLDVVLKENPLLVAIFAFPDIDVGPNATLVLDSVGLVCNTLRVHVKGQVIVSGQGPIRIEMNNYQLYGQPLTVPHGRNPFRI